MEPPKQPAYNPTMENNQYQQQAMPPQNYYSAQMQQQQQMQYYNQGYAYAVAGAQPQYVYQVPAGVGHQQQVIVTQAPQQPQIILIENPDHCHHGPSPPSSQVCKARIRTGYGIVRCLQFLIAVTHLILMSITLSTCFNSYYYIALIVFPCGTIIESVLQMLRYKCRSWAYSGCNDITFAIMYFAQGTAIILCYYFLWTQYLDTLCYAGYHYSDAFDVMTATSATAFALSVTYWIAGCSVCCCKCLETNMPQNNYASMP